MDFSRIYDSPRLNSKNCSLSSNHSFSALAPHLQYGDNNIGLLYMAPVSPEPKLLKENMLLNIVIHLLV